jgi:hypothetical protein
LVFRRRSSINVGRVYFWWHVLCVSALAEVFLRAFKNKYDCSSVAWPISFPNHPASPCASTAASGAASLAAYSPPKLPPDPLAITEKPSHTIRVSCFLIDSGQCGISKPLASRCPCQMGHLLSFLPSWGVCSPTNRHSNRFGPRRAPQAFISVNMTSHQGP